MSNPYYGVTGSPASQSRATSSTIRNEYVAIQTGFDAVYTAMNTKGAITGQTWTGTHSFPATFSIGPVSAAEIGYLDGVTSAIQTQIDSKGAKGGQTWTGTHDYTGGVLRMATQSYPTAGTYGASVDYVAAAIANAGVASITGKAGKFLTNDGSVTSWGSGGLVLIATLTPTAAAAISAPTLFSSAYDSYVIVGQGLSCASDQKLWMRLALAGALDSSSNYINGASVAHVGGDAQFILTGNTADCTLYDLGTNFTVEICNANDSAHLKGINGWVQYMTSSTGNYNVAQVAGTYIGVNIVRGFGLLWSSGGNFKAQGTIRIYGRTTV